jgi:CRP/FNR family transcriptional regulator, cyclic AMP receptor protein
VPNPKYDLIRNVPLFAELNRREVATLAKLLEEVDVPAGRVIIRQGRRGSEFFIILDGRVRIERDGNVLSELGPGDFLGEIALVDGRPRTASAITEEPSRLFVLTSQSFNSMLRLHPAVESKVLRALAQRVRKLDPQTL